LKQGRRGGKPATNRLSYERYIIYFLTQTKFSSGSASQLAIAQKAYVQQTTHPVSPDYVL
jgi:hypothetical protein